MAVELTKGRPASAIIRFVIPVVGGSLFQLFYTIADTLIVGQTIGENALAAVGSTTVFIYFILVFIQGLTSGFSIILGQRFGRGDMDAVKRSVAASVYISIAVTAVITVITCSLVPLIVRLMKIPEEIAEDASIYLLVVLLGTGATVFYNLISNVLRALGDSRIPLIFLVFSSVLNVVLDIVFIVPFGMGVGGAALATVLSQLLAAVLSVIAALRNYPVLRIGKEYWTPHRQSIVQNMHMGFIMGFQMSVMCIGQLVMQASVNKLGTFAIAGYTAATKVDQLSSLVNHSFLTAVAAYTAQNYGAGNVDRIRKGIWSSLILAEIADFIMIGIILLVQPFIVPMFVTDASPEVFGYASDFFLITLPFYPLLGMLCVYRTAVQSMGNSLAPFAACIIELVARCSASIIFGDIFGYRGVVFSTPFAWIGADLLVIPVYAYMIRKLRRTGIKASI